MNSSSGNERNSIRRAVVAILVTMTLVVGSVAVAAVVSDAVRARLGVSGKSMAPTASALSKKKVKLTAKVLQGPLMPGIKHPLQVTITNPLSKTLSVTSIKVTVGKPKGAAGCKPSWVKTTSFKATKKTKPIKVKPHKKAKVKLSIVLNNLTTVNQDACKSTSFPLKLKASAK